MSFVRCSMEEDQDYELGEEKSIVLRVPKPAAPPKGECGKLLFFFFFAYVNVLYAGS